MHNSLRFLHDGYTTVLFEIKGKLELVNYLPKTSEIVAAITNTITIRCWFPWPKWNIPKQRANWARNAICLKDNKEVSWVNGFGSRCTSTLQKDGMEGEVFDSSPMGAWVIYTFFLKRRRRRRRSGLCNRNWKGKGWAPVVFSHSNSFLYYFPLNSLIFLHKIPQFSTFVSKRQLVWCKQSKCLKHFIKQVPAFVISKIQWAMLNSKCNWLYKYSNIREMHNSIETKSPFGPNK